MGTPNLFHNLQRQGLHLSRRGENIVVWPRSAMTNEARNLIRLHKAELLAELRSAPDREARRQRALAMLDDNPALRRAIVSDGLGDPVSVTVAIRDEGLVELLIPASRYEPFKLMELAKKHSVAGLDTKN